MKKILTILPFIALTSSCNKPDKEICVGDPITISDTISITDKEIEDFFNLKTGDTTANVIISSQEELSKHIKFGNTMPTTIDFEHNMIVGGCLYNRNKTIVTSQSINRACKGSTVTYTVTLTRGGNTGGFTSYFAVIPKLAPGTMVTFNRVYKN